MSELVGFMKKSDTGRSMKINLSMEAIESCETYEGMDGSKFIELVINFDRVRQVMRGEREVTSICQVPGYKYETEYNEIKEAY